MPAIPIKIIGGAYEGRSRNNIQELINMYVEYDNYGGQDSTELRGTPGLTEWFDSSTTDQVRGFDIYQNQLWCVIGDTLYYIDGPSTAGGSKTEKGTIDTSEGRVQIENNGSDLAVCDGQYVYNLTYCVTDQGNITVSNFLALAAGSFGDYYTFTDSGSGITAGQIGVLNNDISATITAADYSIFDATTDTTLVKKRTAGYLTQQDTWFIISVPNSGSALATTDPSDWTGAASIAAERNPDYIISMISDHRELILFGDRSIEVNYTTGSAVLPFAPVSGGYLEIGCGAKNSVVKMNNQVYFLDDNNQIRRLTGLQADIISTPSISYQISELSDTQEAIGYSYSIEGHFVYVITFDESDITYCFDSTTGLWYKWSTGGYNKRHTSNCFIRYSGVNLVGDKSNGKIYKIDPDSRTDDGTSIYRERTTQYITNRPRNTFFDKLILWIQTATEPGDDPQIMLDWSDDYGNTYSTIRQESVGKSGEFNIPVEFCALGSAKDRVFRIRITDDCFVSIQNAELIGSAGWY